MPTYRDHLPQLDAHVFLADGGLETTLIFDDGFELPDFAAFSLLRGEDGRAALVGYYESYVAIAQRDGVGIALDTATWRASADWAGRLGWSLDELAAVNRDAVDLLVELRRRHESATSPIVISGCIGPRGDGYQVQSVMTVHEARNYHALQAQTFAGTEPTSSPPSP